MKKTLAFLLIAASVAAQAASVDWVNSSKRNTFIFDKDGNKFNGTAYLVFANDVATITNPTETKTFEDLLGDYSLEDSSISNGAYARSQARVDSDDMTAGQEYEFQVILVDSNGNYSLSSKVKQSAYENGVDDATILTFGANDLGAVGSASASTINWNDKPVYGGGETPGVPEPATGALALAGVALLFKRRRA